MVQPQMGVACVGVTKTDVMDLMNVNPQFLPQVLMSLHLQGINLIKENVPNHCDRFGRDFNITRPFSEYKVFFIGSESATLTNFMLTYPSNQVMSNYCILYLP